ncbi:MAG TPA: hypothetical protein DCX54_12335 [Flavobacteriales bacterium]|nr:hypothetical protein [Flavobacteriales bacterium]
MSDDDSIEKMKNPNYLDTYKELCNSYHAIDDFRAKLLALLPFATGVGAVFLLGNIEPDNQKYLEPLGFFGFVVTLGLFVYEIFGIHKCHALIKSGKYIETLQLKVDGQFRSRPPSVLGFIDEPFAAGIIYPAVLASWLYIALIFLHPQISQSAAIVIFFAGLVCMLIYKRWLRMDADKFEKELQEEINATQ